MTPLPDADDWDAFDSARHKLRANFSHAIPAARYTLSGHTANNHSEAP